MINILYVDDEPSDLEVGKLFLESTGEFAVDTADSAKKALARENLELYDAIVSDYQMPGMDGIRFLQQIRSAGNSVPFILFTGRGREEIAIQALNAGADIYLQKGGEPKTLFGELGHKLQVVVTRNKAEKGLRESEIRFRELFNTMKNGVAVYEAVDNGADFVFRDFNRAAEEIDKCAKDDVIGRRVSEVFPGIREFGLLDVLSRVWRTEQPEHHPVSQYRDERIAGWRENYVYKLPSGDVVAVYADVTEQKQAEEALQQSEAQFSTLFNASPITLLLTRPDDGTLFAVNDAAVALFGYSREELINKSTTGLGIWVNPKEREKSLEIFRRDGAVRNVATSIRTKAGTVRRVLFSSETVVSAGRPAILTAIIDITEHMRAEEAIQESEEKYRTLFERMARGVFCQIADGTLVDVNAAALRMFGLSKEQFLGMDSYNPRWNVITEDGARLPPEEHPSMVALRTGQPVVDRVLGIYIPERQEYTWVSVNAEPQFRPGEANPYRVFVIMDDITGQRKSEQALQTMFRSMVGTTGTDSLKNITGNIRTWLDADCVMIGEIRPDRMTVTVLAMLLDGKDIADFSYPLAGTPCENAVDKGFCCYPDNVRELFPNAKDLADLNIRGYIGTPLRNAGGEVIGVMCIMSRSILNADRSIREIMDIIAVKAAAEIERRQADEALRESEERYRALVDHALEAILIFDFSGTVLFANRAAAALTGADDPFPLHGRNAFEFIAPESHETARADFTSVMDGHDAYLSQYKIASPAIPEQWVESIGKKIQYRGAPAVIVMLRDITLRRKAELALVQANRKLNLLNSITRHDIKNQLLPLKAYLDLSKTTLGDAEKTLEFIRREERIANTIERQILFTKEYENLGCRDPVWQNVGENIGLAARDLDLTGITLDSSRMDAVEIVAAPLLRKVFFNLIDNALRYGGEKMRAIRFSFVEANGSLVITCEDDGAGIPAREKELIFERGYGQNTGYGLFLIREILGITGITIAETGEFGRGARFEITVAKDAYRIIQGRNNSR